MSTKKSRKSATIKRSRKPTKASRKQTTKRSRKSRQNKSHKTIDKLHTKPKGVPNVPWKELTAMNVTDRNKMADHCFLDRARRKYPACYKGSDELSCVGLQAAKQRARLQKNDVIQKRAMDFETQFHCNESGQWEEREARIYSRRQ
jgi:hypothetical protein